MPVADHPAPVTVAARFFAGIREAAGRSADSFTGATVADVAAAADARYGAAFAQLRTTCRVWVNGEPADDRTVLRAGDEVAFLPPVSGGCR